MGYDVLCKIGCLVIFVAFAIALIFWARAMCASVNDFYDHREALLSKINEEVLNGKK